MGILSASKIKLLVLPHMSVGKRGFKSRLCLIKVLQLIFKRLKTGCQWRELSVQEYFGSDKVSWPIIYYYFRKWSVDGSFQRVWIALLQANKHRLDLSSVQLDGSHTPCKRGGIAVGYQGRKACKTSNSLFLCDNNGQMLAVATPQSGEHNDLFNIQEQFMELLALLESATISHEGIFLNADPGFDSELLSSMCQEQGIELNVKPNPRNAKQCGIYYRYYDEELYKRRTKIEHANAWMDAFKALLIRYEKKAETWLALQWMAFIVMFTRKLKV